MSGLVIEEHALVLGARYEEREPLPDRSTDGLCTGVAIARDQALKILTAVVVRNDRRDEGAGLVDRRPALVGPCLEDGDAATRANVAQALDTTVGWTSGLTVGPLSWSPGDHHAATTLHAFDVVSRFGGQADFRYVDDSARTDTFASEV